MDFPKVSIIILNWNGLDYTIDCLESLKKLDYPDYDIVVVDNGSKGNDAKVLQERYQGYIHLIKNSENLGYAGGINTGIDYVIKNTQGTYILLLNNDTVCDPAFLKLLITAAKSDKNVGITGPKVYYYDYPDRIQSAGNTVNLYTGQITMIGNKQVDTGRFDGNRKIDFFAPCMLIKNKVIEQVGMLDESYFCYWEDVDYCIRARKAGYRILYISASHVWHRTPVKLKLSDRTKQDQKVMSLFPYYYITRNSWIFMKKHANGLQFATFCLYFFTLNFIYMTAVSLLYHRSLKLFSAFIRGMRDGINGVTGNSFD